MLSITDILMPNMCKVSLAHSCEISKALLKYKSVEEKPLVTTVSLDPCNLESDACPYYSCLVWAHIPGYTYRSS